MAGSVSVQHTRRVLQIRGRRRRHDACVAVALASVREYALSNDAAEKARRGVSVTSKPYYEAAWAPGLGHDIDPDESLALGFRWLAAAEKRHGGAGVVVMYAKRMAGNRPLLAQAASRWDFVSPRSNRPRGHGPVLAIWPPSDRVLEFAEELAIGTALCVIPSRGLEITPWVRRTGAQCLTGGFEVVDAPALPPEVTKSLDSMLFFGGHNNFLGGGEKEDAIRRLHKIAARSDAPSRARIEDHLRASGETDANGVERAGKWYEEVLDGRRHRDYRGRVIS